MQQFLQLLILIILSACQVKTDDGSSIVATSNSYTVIINLNNSTAKADGVESITANVNIKQNGIPAVGLTPVLNVTGSNNINVSCTASDANGDCLCQVKSTKSESKSISVKSPAISLPGLVTFTPGPVDATASTITGSGPTVANGSAASTININLKDAFNNPISGVAPSFSATGTTNVYSTCTTSNASGSSTCSLKSTKAEVKTLKIETPISKTGGTVIFMGGAPVAANSTITGTGPVVADGATTSSITITLMDFYNNPSPAVSPTFTATDTGGKNIYGSCSITGITGVSTCTLKSLGAELKTLNLISPFAKTGGTVLFTPVSVSADNSTISGTGPVLANGASTSTVTINLKDGSNNPVSGVTPTFSATDTGINNSYTTCSVSDASGISTCTLASNTAETKTLSITTPVVKTGSTVVFTTPTADPANSSITGSGPVTANGSSTSTITIILKDSSNTPLSGVNPTFNATDSGPDNSYGSCSTTSALGISSCTLASETAETKTLSILTPIVKIGGTVVFTSPTADPVNSTITGTSPVVADGSATSTITITLKDSSNNPVSGQTPTFSATGSTNNYGTCSASNTSGVSSCTLASGTAETKTLSIQTPVLKAGGNVIFTSASADPANSSITGSGPVLADGSATSTITITLKDASNIPVVGQTPTFSATGTSNTYGSCSATDATGVSTCALNSTKAEVKTLSIATPIVKTGGTVTFTAGAADIATSNIIGTSPVVADGSATSTVTITLKDANNNPVSGQTPTFTATGTTNNYDTCSPTDATGVSTCALDSTTAEVKTLSIATPFVKAGGTVTFTAGAADVANSSITGTSPVVADGSATSTVTITLKDANNNPVSGQTPTFSATGSTNNYGTCSATDASGVSTCALDSTTAEIKTLSIATPVVKAGGTVTFTAAGAVALKSSIQGTGSVVADGQATSSITITLRDANENPVSGVTPEFTASGTSNNPGFCTATNQNGESYCQLSSTKAETKTLSITSPFNKPDGEVIFIAGPAVAGQSSITGSTNVMANGQAQSNINIILRDAFSNPIIGQTPVFSVTGTGNLVESCGLTNNSGSALCTLKSTKAEVKTLSITSPVNLTGGSVTFIAGAADPSKSTIEGTGPVLANGSDQSLIVITLKDAFENPLLGVTPTFVATGTPVTNTYVACSSTDSSGVSNCHLKSTAAELKTLTITSPINKSGGTVLFNPGPVSVANSNITGTSQILADGVATSTVTITLKDQSNNPVTGITPEFEATNTGTTNEYDLCTDTDENGESTCSFKSTKAEIKTLSIKSPISRIGGTVTFIAGAPSVSTSTITGSQSVVANNTDTATITITILDYFSNPIINVTPTYSVGGSGNNPGNCQPTNQSGVSTCTLTSTKAESKTLSITTPINKTDGQVVFIAGAAVATYSSITGTGPTPADGTTSSTISITLKDAFENPVSGLTPEFEATGTTNNYGNCDPSSNLGVSQCTLKSLTAETKTLSIKTPFTKAGGNVIFTAGFPVATYSEISGTGPVIANGSATSTITITLKDSGNNPVEGMIPTFTASGTSNSYDACSPTNSSGISQCTLRSTKAEIKTLSIATPVSKAGGNVTFIAGSAVAATSSITGTTNITANNLAASDISITLLDAHQNPVSGITPQFNSTGSSNTIGTCSASTSTGVSTCTLKSTKAEIKTLSISSPFAKTGSTVTFVAGAADPAFSSITGTSPVSADGFSMSIITVTLYDAHSNPVAGALPIFNATGSNNNYGQACPATNSSGISTCSLASITAEVKTLQLTSPVAVTGGDVTFSALLPTSQNSSISGTTPITADGVDSSTVTITLKDASNNPTPGITPQFKATDTNNKNSYVDCSMSDAGGVSICYFSSFKAEAKTLEITAPVTKTGSIVNFVAGAAVAGNSSISGTTPVVADNNATSTITITLEDAYNNRVSGQTPTFMASGSGNTVALNCSATDQNGIATCALKSTKAESKIPQIQFPVSKAGSPINFVAGDPVVANSTITGTGPVNPDGSSTSTISITLKDQFSNNVQGVTPTFSATGSNNQYGDCSPTDTTGISHCSLASTTAETKTLSVDNPITFSGGTVVFQTGSAVAANSSIVGTGPVIADGVATSNITITLRDGNNSAVINQTPTFSVGGTSNSLSSCTVTNASGVSTCTLTSTKAESKTLEISSPVVKSGDPVLFEHGPASMATSTIVGNGPCKANGVDVCNVTITLKDQFGNAVDGTIPTFSLSGTLNNLQTCSSTDSLGVSTCGVTSTKPEAKTFQLTSPVTVAGNSLDFNPNGINLQVPIELVDRGLSSSTAILTFNRTRTTFNPADYVAQTNVYMFEIIADNTNTTTSYTVNLVNNANTVITDSAIVVPPNTTNKRFSVLWTPSPTADNYRVRFPATAAGSQLKVHTARIVVEQTAAVATKLYIPLTQANYSLDAASDATGTTTQTTSITGNTYATTNYMTIFKRDDAFMDNYDSGTPWTLETITTNSSTAGTADVALYNKSTNLAVTGAMTTHTGTTTLTHKTTSFATTATNFSNNSNYELRMKSSNTTRTTRLYKAGLWVKLKFLRKAEVVYRIGQRNDTATTVTIPDGRVLWDAGAWSNPTVYFQVVASNSSANGSSFTLMDHATTNNGTAGAVAVTGATLNATTTFGILKSSALTLNDMSHYIVRQNYTTGTNVFGSSYLLIQAKETP